MIPQGIYPKGIYETVEANQKRLEGYMLVDIISGGHDTKIALFKREHIKQPAYRGYSSAATDMIAIDTRGFISEMSI